MKQPKKLSPPEYINRLFEGDCLDIMEHLPDDSVDMVLCDLPYGTTQNKWDSKIPLIPLFKEYKRILTNRGNLVLFGMDDFL